MIPDNMHGDCKAIMWMLSIHYKQFKELNEIRGVSREMGQQTKVDEEKIDLAKEQIKKLNNEQNSLILESESVRHFLLARTFAERCKVQTKILLSQFMELIDP